MKNQIRLSGNITQGISSGLNCYVIGGGNPGSVVEVKHLALNGNG